MVRCLCLTLLAGLIVVASCGRSYVKRGPAGDIVEAGVVLGSKGPLSGCYVMTLSPGLQNLMGEYVNAGTVCRVFLTERPATVPFYHLENESSTDHLYTASRDEADKALGGGYRLKDTYYVYTSPANGGIALYRLSLPGVPCHYYTTAETTRDSLIATDGYTYEFVACYVPPDSVGGARLLYRMKKISKGP